MIPISYQDITDAYSICNKRYARETQFSSLSSSIYDSFYTGEIPSSSYNTKSRLEKTPDTIVHVLRNGKRLKVKCSEIQANDKTTLGKPIPKSWQFRRMTLNGKSIFVPVHDFVPKSYRPTFNPDAFVHSGGVCGLPSHMTFSYTDIYGVGARKVKPIVLFISQSASFIKQCFETYDQIQSEIDDDIDDFYDILDAHNLAKAQNIKNRLDITELVDVACQTDSAPICRDVFLTFGEFYSSEQSRDVACSIHPIPTEPLVTVRHMYYNPVVVTVIRRTYRDVCKGYSPLRRENLDPGIAA